ncbi:hypothetical protein ACFE04_020910 [Oxalis oulophora]
MAKKPDPKGKKKNGKKKIKTRTESEPFMPTTDPMSSLPTHMPNNISSPPPPSTQAATITPSNTFIHPSRKQTNAPMQPTHQHVNIVGASSSHSTEHGFTTQPAQQQLTNSSSRTSSSRSIELASSNTNSSQEPNSTTPNEILIAPRIKKHIELLGKQQENKNPPWITEPVWLELLRLWATASYKKKRQQGSENRSSNCGGRGFPQYYGGNRTFLTHQKKLKEKTGEDLGIAGTFKKLNTTKKKDGEVVWRNDYYKDVYNNVTQNQTRAINTENNDVGDGTPTSENEPLTEAQAWLDATGAPNKRGHIPGLGGEAIFLICGSSSSSKADKENKKDKEIKDHPFPPTPPPGYPYPTIPPPGFSFSPDPPTGPSTQPIQTPTSDHVSDEESDKEDDVSNDSQEESDTE